MFAAVQGLALFAHTALARPTVAAGADAPAADAAGMTVQVQTLAEQLHTTI